MTFKIADRVRQTSTTAGTGTLTLASPAATDRSFATAIGAGNTTYYIIDDGAGNWEIGIGTVGASTLSRDTVILSSNSNSLVSFPAGSKTVVCNVPSDRFLFMQSILSPSTGDVLVYDGGWTNVPGPSALTAARATLGVVRLAGDTMTGKLIGSTSGTGAASFTAPHGAAPTSPVNGDIWTTTAGVFWRINSVTKTVAFLDSNITGNAATATKLATARNIVIAGDANGTASFDGSANISITATLGTVPASKGGTGQTSLSAAYAAMGGGSLGTCDVTFSTSTPSGTGTTDQLWIQYAP